MTIQIVTNRMSGESLRRLMEESNRKMVKAVVDLEKGVIAVGGDLHADGEALLLDQGSRQENLWGINLYPEKPKPDRIEFSSLINIRPGQGNLSMEVEDVGLQARIREIVNRRIAWE